MKKSLLLASTFVWSLLASGTLQAAAPTTYVRPPTIGQIADCAVPDIAPQAAALYAEPDDAAKVRLKIDPDNRAQARLLDTRIAEHPGDLRALVARAFLRARLGESEASEQDFDSAFALKHDQTTVLWSWGWAKINLGQPGCAIARWQNARKLSGIDQGFWVGYSYAVAYWMIGREQLAVDWYDAAARSFPDRYANWRGLSENTLHWNSAERAVIEQVFVAWQRRSRS